MKILEQARIIVDQLSLDIAITDHGKWLKDRKKGQQIVAKGADFIGLKFSGNISEADFTDCNFSEATFKETVLTGADFTDCNFRNAKFDFTRAEDKRFMAFQKCVFQRTKFYSSRWESLTFANCVFSEVESSTLIFQNAAIVNSKVTDCQAFGDWRNASFVDTDFDGSTFERVSTATFDDCTLANMANLRPDQFNQVSIKNSRFKWCTFDDLLLEASSKGNLVELYNVNAFQTSLKGLKVRTNSFQKCIFTSCDLSGLAISPVNYDLTKTIFGSCDLTGSKFEGVNAEKGRLSRCKLIGSEFLQCDLVRADFQKCDLTSASFKMCDIRGGVLTGSTYEAAKSPNFSESDLTGAIWVTGEVCLPGSVGECVVT